jgi:hypothetical protein
MDERDLAVDQAQANNIRRVGQLVDHAEDRVARGVAPPTACNRFTRHQFGNVWNRSTCRFEEYPMFDQQRHDIDHPHRLPVLLSVRFPLSEHERLWACRARSFLFTA